MLTAGVRPNAEPAVNTTAQDTFMASAIPPEMSAWRKAQELTRKAEEEAMMAEKKSQEAYIWCVAGHDQFTASNIPLSSTQQCWQTA